MIRLGIALLFLSALIAQLDGDRALRLDQAQFSQTATTNQNREKEVSQKEQKLAETRYKSGLCLVAQHPIAPDQIVIGVKAGSIVCDRHGMTAITDRHGQLTILAKTANTAIIQRGIE